MPAAVLALATDLPPPQRLALAYAPARARGRTLALLALDARLGAILRAGIEPIAAQLRLAWWRDVLARPAADWPRGQPVLDSLRDWRDPSGLSGLVDGWEALLTEALTTAEVREFVAGRQAAFACLAGELDVEAVAEAEQAAQAWALADLAANLSDGEERALVADQGRGVVPPPLPRALRPLAVLAGLGARSLRRGGGPLLDGPGSALLALRIGLIGR
jgi:phytoene synthase